MAATLGWTAALLGGACGAFAVAGVFAWLRRNGAAAAGRPPPGANSRPLLAFASFFWLIVDACLVLMPGEALPLPSLLFVVVASLVTWAHAFTHLKSSAVPEPQ